MKKIILFLLVLVSGTVLSSNGVTTVFETPLNNLPENYRIENDGIYGVSSFDVINESVYLKYFDSKNIYRSVNGNLKKAEKGIVESSYLANGVTEDGFQYHSYRNNDVVLQKSGNTSSGFSNINGTITYNTGRSVISLEKADYADIIGIDNNGNALFICENIINDAPLEVGREVRVYDLNGKFVNSFNVPLIKYFYTDTEFVLGDNNNLYQMLITPEKLSVIRYDDYIANDNVDFGKYKALKVHYNDYVTTDEYVAEVTTNTKFLPAANRMKSIKTGEKYIELKYFTTKANLAPTGVAAPDGDIVKTPGWLKEGWNARVPYMWGGFSTVDFFVRGIQFGRYAGDINTQGVTGYAVGADCSGFVSRCWNLNEHYATSMMPGITDQTSWSNIKMGDAIHKVGHVRLFLNKTENGAFRVLEAAGRNWDVSYWCFALSDMSSYTPRVYKYMTEALNSVFVKVTSAEYTSATEVKLNFIVTDEVLNYNVYMSTDGENWNVLTDVLPDSNGTITVTADSTFGYYRIATMIDNDGNMSEGYWSNIMPASWNENQQKVLLVDGFSRNSGSGNWQGYTHNFLERYGRYFKNMNVEVVSIDADYLLENEIDLSNYFAVYWMLGDESSGEKTITPDEESIIAGYLENGGNLFISGSEIGWDIYENGTDDDKSFYNNYLKAAYVKDNAGSTEIIGTESNLLAGLEFYCGQTFMEDYPDQININGGSSLLFEYGNNTGAGVVYDGTFGASETPGKVIYLGFPIESTANDSAFALVVEKSFGFFNGELSSVTNEEVTPENFVLYNNYPNPFNPETTLQVELNKNSDITVEIYNLLGEKVSTLFKGELAPGVHKFHFNAAGFSSGIYLANFRINDKLYVQKLTLLK